jgi:hypothetical protein
MKTHKTQWIRFLTACGWIAAALAAAACSHWPGAQSGSGNQSLTHHFTKGDVDHFLGSVRFQQTDSGEHYRLGRFFQQRGRHMLAATEFSRAIDLDPRRADAHNALGVLYDQLGQFALAEQCYLRAMMLKPDFAAAYNNLGYSYLMQGEPDKAIAPLEKAVSLQGRNARFHNNLALAYRQTGQVERASAEINGPGQELQAQKSDSLRHSLVSIDLTEGSNDTENTSEDQQPQWASASSAVPAAASLPEQSHQAVSDASPPVGNDDNGPDAMPANPGPAPSGLTPRIEIANGNGVAKMAGNIGNYFKYKGFDVQRVTNADHFGYPKTRIFYSDGQRQVACTLSQMLFGPEIVCELIYDYRSYGQIKVLMGKDMAGLNDLFSGGLKIQVANGNGVRNMAGKLTAYLRAKGFYVVKPVNAGNFGHEITQIYYPAGRQANARFVAREFPERDTGRLVEDDRQSDTIYIIIGKDFIL